MQLFKFVEIRRFPLGGDLANVCISHGLKNLVKQGIAGEQLLSGSFLWSYHCDIIQRDKQRHNAGIS